MGRKHGKFPSRVNKNKKTKISNGRKLYWRNEQANRVLKMSMHDHSYSSDVLPTEPPTVGSADNTIKDNTPNNNNVGISVNEIIVSDERNDPTSEVVEESVVLEFSFISRDEYESVMQHEIPIESEPPSVNVVVCGNRIVDLQYVLSWSMKQQFEHSKKCSVGQLQLINEQRSGLISFLTFKCDFCGYEVQQSTHKCENTQESFMHPINVSAVWSTISTGNSYSKLRETLSIMDITPMPYSLFSKIENSLSDAWENNLSNCIEKAGKEEYDIAMNSGNIDKDGNVWVTVYADGGWSHRSFGHSYN